MKKFFITLCIAFAGFSMNAQEFNAGISLGLPSGDASDAYTFAILFDANYLWEVSEEFKLGATAGYINSFGDTIGEFEVEDAGFIPLAAAARYSISEDFAVGADIGYALGVAPDGNDGGFYYAPQLLYSISELVDIVAAYRGISVDNGLGGTSSFDHLTLGVMIGL